MHFSTFKETRPWGLILWRIKRYYCNIDTCHDTLQLFMVPAIHGVLLSSFLKGLEMAEVDINREKLGKKL